MQNVREQGEEGGVRSSEISCGQVLPGGVEVGTAGQTVGGEGS